MPNYYFGAGVQSNPMDAYNETAGMVKQNRLARLLSDAYQAPEESRAGPLAKMMGVDARFGMEAAKMLDPRMRATADNSGQVHSAFRGQNGNMWVLNRAGEVRDTGTAFDPNNQILDTGNGIYGINKSNLSASPVQVGGPPQQPAPQQGGEVPFAIDPSLPPQVQAAIRANPGQWANASEESPIDIAPGGQQLRSVPKPQEVARLQMDAERVRLAQQAAERAAAAEARAQEAAGRGPIPAGMRLVNGRLEQMPGMPAPRTASKTQDAIRAKVPQLQNAIRGLDRIDAAIEKLDGKLVNTGPADALIQKYTPAGQELEAAVGAIQNSVLALTRVPGIGSQSDLEARIAMLQYPSLDKPPEVNRRTLANLKLFMRDLAQAYQLAVKPGQAAEPTASSGFRILPD